MTKIQIEIGVKIKEIMVGGLRHDLESGINLPTF
jgi:hypothetical protein